LGLNIKGKTDQEMNFSGIVRREDRKDQESNQNHSF